MMMIIIIIIVIVVNIVFVVCGEFGSCGEAICMIESKIFLNELEQCVSELW